MKYCLTENGRYCGRYAWEELLNLFKPELDIDGVDEDDVDAFVEEYETKMKEWEGIKDVFYLEEYIDKFVNHEYSTGDHYHNYEIEECE